MTPERHCHICDQPADDQTDWVDLQGIDRIWLCTTHRNATFSRLYTGTWLWISDKPTHVVALR